MSKTKIEWAERVWNPVTGCTAISEGCLNCYAKRMAGRLQKMPKTKVKYRNGFTPTFHPECLVDISPREKPAIIFVGSMSDIFHPDFADFDIGLMFGRMAICAQHRFMVLTKRIDRWLSVSLSIEQGFWIAEPWPPKNVAFGTTAENQALLKRRLLELKYCQAAYRFLSLEPLLGEIDLAKADPDWHTYIDLVIVGAETGPKARPMNSEWLRAIHAECLERGVPFHFKSWGDWVPASEAEHGPNFEDGHFWTQYPLRCIDGDIQYKLGKKKAGRLLDGVTHDGAIRWKDR